jgi:hypothetical protein
MRSEPSPQRRARAPSIVGSSPTCAFLDDESFFSVSHSALLCSWGNGLSWGLYFFGYNKVKDALLERQQRIHGESVRFLDSQQYFLASAVTGATILLLTNPVWVLKTRMCAQTPGQERYQGMVHALRTLLREEGIRGAYQGLLPGLFGVSHGAVQFMVYEGLKKHLLTAGRSRVAQAMLCLRSRKPTRVASAPPASPRRRAQVRKHTRARSARVHFHGCCIQSDCGSCHVPVSGHPFSAAGRERAVCLRCE